MRLGLELGVRDSSWHWAAGGISQTAPPSDGHPVEFVRDAIQRSYL